MNHKNNPFKFLDAYTREDRDIYFGRDREIKELYHKVFESKILLLYGISGTGKTSLINCGLANKFLEKDWLSINIRKGVDINKSLSKEIHKIAHKQLKDNTPIVKAVQSVYLDHFKPVFLIFDQFEELFIFGNREEREEFIQTIKELIESDIQCKCLFSIREEYLAGVTEFESYIPEFLSNRMRVERMTRQKAKEVIEGPCHVNGIQVEEGFAESLLRKLNPESSEIELTYLQVFLDKIFKISGDQHEFTLEQIKKVGDVGDLLGSFLEEQINELDDPDTGLVVLKAFVSMQGTKKQIGEEEISDFARILGCPINHDILTELLHRFVNLRVLKDKDENDRYELRHDSLAIKIYEKITLVEKEMLEIRQFLETSYSYFEKRGVFLSSDDLQYIAPFEGRLYISKVIQKFINESKRHVGKVRKRIRRLISAATIVAIIFMAGFTSWALKERRVSQENEIKFKASYYNSLSKGLAESDPTVALRLAEYAMALRSNEIIQQNLIKIYRENSFYNIIAEHEDHVSSVAFSPDGKSILTGSSDNTARLWDLAGNVIQVFRGHEDRIESVAFSPDSKYILTGSTDKTARLWDLSGNVIQVFKGHEDRIISVSYSPDGKSILTGSGDRTARLWDLSGRVIQVFKGHEYIIFSVAFSPDGKYILTGSFDDTARLWDLSGNVIRVFTGHENRLRSVTFSPDGKYILTGSIDKTAILWDLLGNIIQVLRGHENIVSSVAFSPDGKYILTGSNDKTARLWDLAGNEIQVFKGHENIIWSVSYSPDGKSILTGSWDRTARLWDLPGNEIQFFKGHEESSIRAVAFSPDEKSILTGSSDNTARLWDLAGNVIRIFRGHEESILSVAFSPDGKYILTGSWDKTARLCDLSGRVIQIFKGHEGSILSVAFSPDGKSILTGSIDNAAKLWDLSGNVIQLYKGHEDVIHSVAFSPDGKYILTGSNDKTARLWDLSGNEIYVFKGHEREIYSAAFSPDGKYLLTGSVDNTARLWDLSGKVIRVFKGHESFITSVAFSPDGKNILTGSYDETAILWDLAGNVIQVFRGSEAIIFSVAFSPDGKYILIGSNDKTARLYERKTYLAKYQERNRYEKLSINQKIEYEILNYSEIIEIHNSEELYLASKYYYEQANFSTDHKKAQDHLKKAYNLLVRSIEITNKAKYLIALSDVLLLEHELDPYNSDLKHDIEDLHDRFLSIQGKDEQYEVFHYYLILCSDLDSILLQFHYPDKALEFCDLILKQYPDDETLKGDITRNCSNVSYELLCSKEFTLALNFAELAKKSDPSYEYTYTNLPLAYILNDQYDKALEIYEEWKDKLFTADDGSYEDYEFFKDVFLLDLDDLESKGIMHSDFHKIRFLLKNELKESDDTE